MGLLQIKEEKTFYFWDLFIKLNLQNLNISPSKKKNNKKKKEKIYSSED